MKPSCFEEDRDDESFISGDCSGVSHGYLELRCSTVVPISDISSYLRHGCVVKIQQGKRPRKSIPGRFVAGELLVPWGIFVSCSLRMNQLLVSSGCSGGVFFPACFPSAVSKSSEGRSCPDSRTPSTQKVMFCSAAPPHPIHTKEGADPWLASGSTSLLKSVQMTQGYCLQCLLWRYQDIPAQRGTCGPLAG